MAQLESGKIYIVNNIGIKDYINEGGSSYDGITKYFTWLSEKIATGLDIEMQPIFKAGAPYNCFLPLPYINDPTENKLCLYMATHNIAAISPSIGYLNKNNKFDSLIEIMYDNQANSVKYKNSTSYLYNSYNEGVLHINNSSSFIIDTRFLEDNGFYTISFLGKITNEVDEVIIAPRVFICDMVDVLTGKHYDGAFSLPNPNSIYNYPGGKGLSAPSIAAIGVDKDGKYSSQGYYPQIFASDYSSAGTRTQETLISASP